MTHQHAVQKQSVERYLLDEMPEIERYAFEEHLFDCGDCAEDVRTGALMREGVAAGMILTADGSRQAADGSRQTQDGRRETADGTSAGWRYAMPWAVAATLAMAVGYQSLWVVPELRDQVVGPAVLSPLTLRGATRGSEPTLNRPTSGVASLAVDLAGVTAGARLTYDLRAADGTSVASGTAAAPPPGTPLLLLLPASALDSTGRYVLSVRAGDGPGSASVDYRFTIIDP